ncbi:MAG: Na+/H+ antiporter subunit E [Sphingomonas paucimobilis]
MTIARRIVAVPVLLLAFLWDLLFSSFVVAAVVLRPRLRTRPAILVLTTDLEQPWAVALLAYLTSLTPGSTCLHVSADRRRLYLHVLDAPDPAATLARFRRLYERWVRELAA